MSAHTVKCLDTPESTTPCAPRDPFDSRRRWAFLLVSLSLTALPFLAVTFPPITDLPQQTAQIRLFLDAWGNPESPYHIQWYTPYTLSYLVLGLSWALTGPEHAGRIAMMLIALSWVAAIHLWARAHDRSPVSATFASVFVFNHIVYWGFYSFAVGAPVFLLWDYLISRKSTEVSWPEAAFTFGVGALLYCSHVLWFGVGVAWLTVRLALFPGETRIAILRAASLSPIALVVFIWYPVLAHSAMSTPGFWAQAPWERLNLSLIADALLGGIHGPLEPVFACLAFLWVAVGLFQHMRNKPPAESLPQQSVNNTPGKSDDSAGENTDTLGSDAETGRLDAPTSHLVSVHAHTGSEALLKAPALLAAMLLAVALIAPDKYMNTIQFAQRWAPIGMIILLLAVPAPRISMKVLGASVIALVAGFAVITAATWREFETRDLSGLSSVLQALPDKPSVLGLSYMHRSRYIKHSPFIQVFAYSQVYHGGRLNFSFAEFSPCLVTYKERFIPPWTSGLEWVPKRAVPADLAYFSHVIVQAEEAEHEKIAAIPGLRANTAEGRWRLYKTAGEGIPR